MKSSARIFYWLLGISTCVLLARFAGMYYAERTSFGHMVTLDGLAAVFFAVAAPFIAGLCALFALIVCVYKKYKRENGAGAGFVVFIVILVELTFLFLKLPR